MAEPTPSSAMGGGRRVGSAALCLAYGYCLSEAHEAGSSNHGFYEEKYYCVSSILCYNLRVLGRELLELGLSHSSDPRLSKHTAMS